MCPLTVTALFLVILSTVPRRRRGRVVYAIVRLYRRSSVCGSKRASRRTKRSTRGRGAYMSRTNCVFPSDISGDGLRSKDLVGVRLPILCLFTSVLAVRFSVPVPRGACSECIISCASMILNRDDKLHTPPCFFSWMFVTKFVVLWCLLFFPMAMVDCLRCLSFSGWVSPL